jgi:hypothetical protein
VQELDGVRVPELVRREPAAHPGLARSAMYLEPGGASRPSLATSGSDDHTEQRADG